MDDIVVKASVVCHTEKGIDGFFNKDRECEQCNIKKVLKITMVDMVEKMGHYKNVDINMHVLKIWIIG